jgi:hypothetical protein
MQENQRNDCLSQWQLRARARREGFFEFSFKFELALNCTMNKVMHKFLIYLSIYFYLTCFGLPFSPSSEADVQLRQWFKSPGSGVSARAAKYLQQVKNFKYLSCEISYDDGKIFSKLLQNFLKYWEFQTTVTI